jgi:hypothetical protein
MCTNSLFVHWYYLCSLLLTNCFLVVLITIHHFSVLMSGCSWWSCWESTKSSCISSGLLILLFNFLLAWTCSLTFFFYLKSYFSCSSYLSVQIRLRDYGVLDFDAGDTHRQPPVDTTWQQVIDKFLF